MSASALTIVRNRTAHLLELVEGLRRSAVQPDELIIVDMSDEPIDLPKAGFPILIDRFATDGLPLAAARNRAARLAMGDHLLFLDVDCIPLSPCLGKLVEVLKTHDALLCADVRYLGPDDARGAWIEDGLLAQGRPHPARDFPVAGFREEPNPGLFWSLAFALRRSTFERLGGFDEGFTGYGGEDTDFGFRAAEDGLKLLFVGGAVTCHQYHDSFEPPVQHVEDIVRNARLFHSRWGRWPMEGWLKAFASLGLIRWRTDSIDFLRPPSLIELESARVGEVR